MKTFSFCRRFSIWLLAGTLATLADGASFAAGGGGGASGGAGGATGAGVSAGAAGGGGHGGGGGVSLGGGHAVAGAGGTGGTHAASGFSGGAGSVGSSNSGQHVSPGFSTGHPGGLVPTGFTSPQGTGVTSVSGTGFSRAVNPAYGTLGRGSVANGRVVENGFGSVNRGFGGGQPYGGRPVAPAFNTSRIHNAWTEGNNPHVNPAVRASRYGYNRDAYDQDRSALQNQLGAGQHLYPNASNYNALTAAHNHAWQGPAGRGNDVGGRRGGEGNYNRQTRDAYNRFFFTSALFPYLYGSFFPAYYGYYDNGYLGGGFGDYSEAGDGSLNANYGTPTFNGASGPYVPTDGSQYDNAPTNSAPQNTPPTDDQNLPPNQPSSVGPQNPPATEDRASSESGPDTLVESVQNELAKRGYYGGKVDSMYNPATQTALRRFQTDQHLAATGRINEATLHALQLD